MIEEVDETLRGLIRTEVLSGSQVEVSFDAPTKDWAARRNAPTINLYLYDIREDLSRRDAAWAPIYAPEGYVTGHHASPRHFKLQYMVTAWTQRPEDEHRLLSACLGLFLRHETLGPAEMSGALAEQPLPALVSVALPLGPDRSIADVWSALGGELKPSLDLVFNAPFVVGRSIAAGAPVREMPRLSIARPGDSGRPELPTPTMRARRGGPLGQGLGPGRGPGLGQGPGQEQGEEQVPATQDETVVGGTKAKPGRVYRIRGYPRP
jgi:hypothetical protein